MCQLLHVPFGDEGIQEGFYEVFVFIVELFDFFELPEQFFVCELGGRCFVLASVH